jgi:hypothetical protein
MDVVHLGVELTDDGLLERLGIKAGPPDIVPVVNLEQ